MRAIECLHSEDPLTPEDKVLILAHQAELQDHITVDARVVLEAVVNEHHRMLRAMRGYRRNVPGGDITSSTCTILGFLERNGDPRLPADRARPLLRNLRPSTDGVRMLPRPVILAAAEASRLRALERNGESPQKKDN